MTTNAESHKASTFVFKRRDFKATFLYRHIASDFGPDFGLFDPFCSKFFSKPQILKLIILHTASIAHFPYRKGCNEKFGLDFLASDLTSDRTSAIGPDLGPDFGPDQKKSAKRV